MSVLQPHRIQQKWLLPGPAVRHLALLVPLALSVLPGSLFAFQGNAVGTGRETSNVQPRQPELVPQQGTGTPVDPGSSPSGGGNPQDNPDTMSGTSVIPPQLFGTQPDWYGYGSPVRVAFHGGQNYVEPSSFVTLSMLRTLQNWKFQSGSQQISYLDLRGGLNLNGLAAGLLQLSGRQRRPH